MSNPPTRFRPSPVSGPRDARVDAESEAARAAGWSAGWAAGSRAAAEAATNQRHAIDEVERAREAERAARAQAALVVLRRAVEAVSQQVIPVLAKVADLLDDGAVTLAEVVLGRELSDADDGARLALARALSLPPEVGVHTVRLHPLDLQVLIDAGVMDELPAGVELVADRTLVPGDAMAEFPDGYLDARVSTAIARARRALEELR